MNIKTSPLFGAVALIVAAAGIAAAFAVFAQTVPLSYEASPEVYKLVAENDRYRVVLATWKPGQRDAWHSHPGALIAYNLTDCSNRFYGPDGKFRDRSGKAGAASFFPIVASHSVENMAAADCQVLLVEEK
jgi:hypothetical protein